jgi:N4-gp56 family major capsid protein
MGKKIKRFHYMPMLDDRNINDQGIDAAGVTISDTDFFVQAAAAASGPAVVEANGAVTTAAHSSGDIVYSAADDVWYLLVADRAIGANLATADTVKSDAAIKAYIEADVAGTVATVTVGVITLTVTALKYETEAASVIATQILGGSTSRQGYGNMYGSSKDIGTVVGKLPVLSENGGYVNRVGFKRIEIEGTLEKFGFYDTYTKESMDFDSDAEKESHINREMLRGANEITEDMLQIDLLNSAAVTRFSGVATSDDEVTGVTADGISEVDYDDFSRLAITLDNNRCPKNTKIISGSRMVDTKTIGASRVMFIGSELVPTIERMQDHFSNQAFIPVQKYANAGNTVNGEIGSVGHFRIVVDPEMFHWAGAGAAEGENAGYAATNGRYDIYPMMVVGSESFTTIGFETSGNEVKFKIKHSKPESPESYANDPYGETGFMSIKWYYGFLPERTERLAVVKTVARQ